MQNKDIRIEIIYKLSPNSAAGLDRVPSCYWSTVLPSYPLCYCLCCSHSPSDGVIPISWERADIIPIYKSGDKTVPSNYHLISLTSVICKVLEIIIKKLVFSFLGQKGCLNSIQHGFRPGRSCLSALLDVLIIVCTC